MSGGDFRSNEVSATLDKAATAKIVLTTDAGEDIVLKEGVSYPRAPWWTPHS
jgi:isocitrate dehydrogenase